MESTAIEPNAIAALAAALGATLCFFGQKLFAALLVVAGLVTGALVGGGLAAVLWPESSLALLVAVAGTSLLFGLLFKLAAAFGVFLLGGIGGGMVGAAAAASFGLLPQILAAVATGLVAGSLALRLRRAMVALSTAIIGGGALVSGVMSLAFGTEATRAVVDRLAAASTLTWIDWSALATWAGLAAVGAGTQLRRRRRR